MKNLDGLTTNLIAHRGLHNKEKNIPENSILAFKRAVRCGYNIELDVHLTKDKKVVVFHDNSLNRMCNTNKLIEDCTYDEILKYNLGNTKYKIPLLKDVLNLINGQVFLFVETKSLKFDGELEYYLSKLLDEYNGPFAVHSFNIFSINWFKKHKNNYIRGLLSSDFSKWNMSNLRKWIGKTLISDIFLKTDFISYDIRSLPNIYVSLKRKKKIVLGWTIRNKKDYEKSLEFCDNLICDNLEEYKKNCM